VAESFVIPEGLFRHRNTDISGMFRISSIVAIWNKRASCVLLAKQVRPRRALKLAAGITVLLIGQVGIINERVLIAATKDAVTWDAVFVWIQRDWPEVPQMSTRELAERLAANNGVHPLLIDVRTRQEYEVSHLPGAVWAETPQQIASALREASDGQAVVLYCSVGVRSSKAAATLVRSRRANVFNLQGSIFQWANEGRTLVANGRTVHVVHPYNERWGVLLNPQLHPVEFGP
jgi:rhodanese-related sulfurtransferase